MKTVLCFDLGASSGRGIVARYIDNKLELKEVHRFQTTVVEENGKVYWDFFNIFQEIKLGIKKVIDLGIKIDSIGIDTWGCDYGWLDKDGKLLRNPRAYRTELPKIVIEEVHRKILPEEHYNICGNAYFSFNTIYQLYYDIKYEKLLDKGAKKFLFMPNLIFYFLTGEKIWEYTISSTSGLLNAKDKNWSDKIFEKLEIPDTIKGDITFAGNTIFPLKEDIKKELGVEYNINISLVTGHDSACAVVGAPISKESCYLINGTWSLLGIENEIAITELIGREKGMVNEGSFDKKVRYMSMMVGTFILQKLKKDWQEEGENIEFTDFAKLAEKSNLAEYIEIKEEFLTTKSMISLIQRKVLEKYNLRIEKKEDILKIAYNSLGEKYREALELIKILSQRKINEVVLLGGGNQDIFLIKTIRKYLECEVKMGPIEASAVGNAFVQLITLGEFKELDEARKKINIKSK